MTMSVKMNGILIERNIMKHHFKESNEIFLQNFYVCNEQMNEEELPKDKNCRELKKK